MVGPVVTSPSKGVPVTIITDSREQAPYRFNPAAVATTKQALPAGDYSVRGLETRIAIERKTLEDFVSTVIHHRTRFKRELEKLRNYEIACIVVEADLRDIVLGRYRSRAHPNAILASALAIYVDYQIPVFFCSDREITCRFVMGLLVRYQKKQNAKLSRPKGGVTTS